MEFTIRYLCSLFGLRGAHSCDPSIRSCSLRGVGDTTDIVQKETYTFDDRGGRSITLKPGERRARCAFIEHGLAGDTQPTKMYYLNCPVFRYERPQAGGCASTTSSA